MVSLWHLLEVIYKNEISQKKYIPRNLADQIEIYFNTCNYCFEYRIFLWNKIICTKPYKNADDYFIENNLMDFRLVSTVGFDDDDISAIEESEDVMQVMPSYMADVITTLENHDSVVRLHSVPETESGTPINKLNVIEGRLPQNSGECVIENSTLGYGNLNIGDTLKIQPNVGDTKTSTYLKKPNLRLLVK